MKYANHFSSMIHQDAISPNLSERSNPRITNIVARTLKQIEVIKRKTQEEIAKIQEEANQKIGLLMKQSKDQIEHISADAANKIKHEALGEKTKLLVIGHKINRDTQVQQHIVVKLAKHIEKLKKEPFVMRKKLGNKQLNQDLALGGDFREKPNYRYKRMKNFDFSTLPISPKSELNNNEQVENTNSNIIHRRKFRDSFSAFISEQADNNSVKSL